MTTAAAQGAGVWATFRESPLAVKTILAGIFVNRLGGFLNIFMVLYLASRGYSAGQAAAALGVYGAGSVIGVLVGGALADRLGPRNATVISMTGTAALTAALLYLPSYPTLLGAMGLAGLTAQIYRPASATLLSDLTDQSRQVMIFAIYRFGLNFGAMAAPLIGFGLYYVDHERYTLLFLGEALIALAYAVLALITLPARDQRSGKELTDAAAASPDATPVSPGVAKPGGYLAVLRDRRYTLYLTATFLNACVYVQYLSTLPLDIKTSGLPIFWYTFAVSLNGLVVIALELPITRVTQTWPLRAPIMLGTVLVGLGMGVYGLPLGPVVIIIGTLIWTLAEVIGAPATFAYPAIVSPPHLRGRYVGSFQFMFGLGSAVGPVVGGALLSAQGHRVWLMIACGSAVALIFILAGVHNHPKSGVDSADDETADSEYQA
jgi:MFS family permease